MVESDLVCDVAGHDGVVLLVQSLDGGEAGQHALLVVGGTNKVAETSRVGNPFDQAASGAKQHTAEQHGEHKAGVEKPQTACLRRVL